jgi:hypothetical protein
MMVTSRIRARYFWAILRVCPWINPNSIATIKLTNYLKPNPLPAYSDGLLAELGHSRFQNRPRKRYSRNRNGGWSSLLILRRCQTSDTQMTFNGLSPPPSCGRFFLPENRSA